MVTLLKLLKAVKIMKVAKGVEGVKGGEDVEGKKGVNVVKVWKVVKVKFDKNKNKKITTIDRDEHIDILIKRAICFWNIDPEDLWISETASFISAIKMSGMGV